MKSIILFVVKYITVLLVGIIVGIAGVYFFFMATSLVSGGGVVLPHFSIIFPFIPQLNFFAAILSCFCLITQIARQQDMSVSTGLVCVVLHVFTWFIFVPAIEPALVKAAEKLRPEQTWQQESISPGYFRQNENGLLYYFRVREDKTGDGIFIDFASNQIFPRINTLLDAESLEGDVLIRRTLSRPAVLSALLRWMATFNENGKTALARGILVWYAFASICFPLTALTAFAHASRWRLMNFSLLASTFAAILLLNIAYFLYEIPVKLSAFTGFFHRMPILNRLPPEAESYILLVVFNVLTALIIFFCGVRAYVKNKGAPPVEWR